MYEVPSNYRNLMAEYSELVISGLKRKYRIFSSEQIEKKLLEEFTSIDSEYIEDMDVDYELESYLDEEDQLAYFVNDRIGEDFAVLDDFEGYVFCINEVEDFIQESERHKKAKSVKKQQTLKECNEVKLAA